MANKFILGCLLTVFFCSDAFALSTPPNCPTAGGTQALNYLTATNAYSCNPVAAGTGTVTSVSVTTANGVSGSVATATTTPAITLSLGAITPSTVNGLTLAPQTNGFTIAGGTTSKTLTVPLTASVSGTNTGDVTLTGENYLGISGQQITASAVNLSGTNVTGTLAAARMPALTGDTTTSAGSVATTTSKVNGVSYGTSPATNTVPVVTGTNAVTYGAVPNAALATQTANTVLGALTATTPSGLALPSCSASTSALKYTTGVGFGCNNSIVAGTVYLGTSATVPNPSASASDTQTGFYTAGAGTVDVTISGSQKAEFNTTGLALGTSSSVNRLDVNGAVAIGSPGITAPSNGLFVSGNVGIGTTLITSGNLDVYGGAVNGITLAGAATTVAPVIAVNGSDTNINLSLTPKGTGKVAITTITGSTQCLQVDTNGAITGSGATCGGGSSGTVVLGTSTSFPNPEANASTDTTTGEYTVSKGKIDYVSVGTQVAEISTSGVNVYPIAGIAASGAYLINSNNAISFPSSDSTTGGSLAVGYQALNSQAALASTAFSNTSVGYQTLASASLTTSSIQNTAVGYQAMQKITSGQQNTAVGYQAMQNSTTASNNVAIGFGALGNGAGGGQRTAIGYNAGFSSTGNGNTMIGYNVAANTLTTGTNNILIGVSNALDTAASGTSNTIQIGGTGAASGVGSINVTGTNTLSTEVITLRGLLILTDIPGDTAVTDSTVCQSTSTHQLYSGTGTLGICLGTSSKRYKENIKIVDGGLAEIEALKPVNFRFKKGFGDNGLKEQYGFIAEDAAKVLPKLVGYDTKGQPNTFDYLGVVPVLVKAVQEQQVEIDDLKTQLKRRK